MKFYPLANLRVAPRPDLGTEEILAELFEKTILLGKISMELQKVMLYPTGRREQWLRKHESFIDTLLQQCRSQVSVALQGFMMNTAVQPQASEYISTLQQTLSVLERIVQEKKEFQGL